MTVPVKSLWYRRPWVWAAVAVLVLLGVTFGAVRRARSAPSAPTAEVKLGEFVGRVQMRGEVKALKTIPMTAPFGAGDLQLVKLIKTGSQVSPGDLIAQFDSTQLQRQLEQRSTDLKTAEAEIERTRAQLRLTEEQLRTDFEKAKYDVERAKLELSKAEILSEIEGQKNRLNLANAEQKLREIAERQAQDRKAAAAELESRKQKREKALFDVRRVESNIARMMLRAPTAGMVTIMPNYRASGPFSSNAPEFKEGDRAWAGASIAELPDLSSVRVNGRIEETDRGRMQLGQDALIRVDAVPDKELTGRVVEISPLAKADFSGWPPKKNFDVVVQIEQPDARLRPGMSATSRVAVERVPNSILVPSEAVFLKNGRSVVYVLVRGKFEEREVEPGRRGGGQTIIARGLRPGERVALQDPTWKESAEGK